MNANVSAIALFLGVMLFSAGSLADKLPPLGTCLDVQVRLDTNDPAIKEEIERNKRMYGNDAPSRLLMTFIFTNSCPDRVKVQFSWIDDWYAQINAAGIACAEGSVLLDSGQTLRSRKYVANPEGPVGRNNKTSDPAYETVACYYRPKEGEAPYQYDCDNVAPVQCP